MGNSNEKHVVPRDEQNVDTHTACKMQSTTGESRRELQGNTLPLTASTESYLHSSVNVKSAPNPSGGDLQTPSVDGQWLDCVDKTKSIVEERPVSVSLLLDVSGSMEGTKLKAMKSAVKEFLRDNVKEADNVGITTFSYEVKLIGALQPASDAWKTTLSYATDDLEADGCTHMWEAIRGASSAFPSTRTTEEWIVVFSDGESDDYDCLLEDCPKTARQSVIFLGIGLNSAYGAVVREGLKCFKSVQVEMKELPRDEREQEMVINRCFCAAAKSIQTSRQVPKN